MKLKLIKFVLFVYLNHIQEDWDDYNKLGKFFVYPAWVVRSIFMWLLSPLFIPEYLFKQSEVYKAYETQGAMSPDQMAEFNRIQRENFLSRRYGKGGKRKFF